MIKTWYAKSKEKLCNCGANYIKIITLTAQYVLTIQMDIWDIVVIMDGVCG
jgi:hypothetical protein